MKNYLKEHIDYLKDNPEGYWFKRKLYGWGWTPATKEGWGIIILWVVLLILNTNRLEERASSEEDFLWSLIPQTALMVLVLIVICYKTGEKPRWQWSNKK
jgi:hypothetical protein